MPTLTITKTYLNGNILTETDLDNIRSSLTTFFNTTKIDSANVQTGGLLGTNLANGTITSDQLGAASVGTAQLASSAVTTANIGPLAVAQAQIALAAVGGPQKTGLGTLLTSSCGSFTTSSGSLTDVTNLSISITTTGRAVFLALICAAGGGATGGIGGSGTNATTAGIAFVRDSTTLPIYQVQAQVTGSGLTIVQSVPNVIHVDTPAAGTYVYKAQAQVISGSSVTVTNMKLLAFEL